MGSFMFRTTEQKGKVDVALRTHPFLAHLGTIWDLTCFALHYHHHLEEYVDLCGHPIHTWRFKNTSQDIKSYDLCNSPQNGWLKVFANRREFIGKRDMYRTQYFSFNCLVLTISLSTYHWFINYSAEIMFLFFPKIIVYKVHLCQMSTSYVSLIPK